MISTPEGPENKKVAPGKGKATSGKTLRSDDTPLKSDSTTSRILNSKSSRTEAQRARVLELLKISPQTTYTLRAKGLSHCAARIMELRKRGYLIVTSRVTTVDSDGYSHSGVAMYSLEASA